MADANCHFCQLMTNSFAGDPGQWPVVFSHPDGTGLARWHHAHCVVTAIYCKAKALSDFTDAQIATEHGFRMQRALGDQSVCVGATPQPIAFVGGASNG